MRVSDAAYMSVNCRVQPLGSIILAARPEQMWEHVCVRVQTCQQVLIVLQQGPQLLHLQGASSCVHRGTEPAQR